MLNGRAVTAEPKELTDEQRLSRCRCAAGKYPGEQAHLNGQYERAHVACDPVALARGNRAGQVSLLRNREGAASLTPWTWSDLGLGYQRCSQAEYSMTESLGMSTRLRPPR
jgi:hypothetical protein